MKFIVSQHELNKALAICNKAVANNFILATGCFRLKGKGAELEISSCNHSISISTTIMIDGNDVFDVLIDASKLKSIINSYADQPLEFDISKEINPNNPKELSFKVNIKSHSGIIKLTGLDGTHFPEIKSENEDKFFFINFNELASAFYNTSYALMAGDTGACFEGLSFEFHKSGLLLLGCNKDRLHAINIHGEYEGNNIVIPAEMVNLIKSLTLNCEATIKYSKSSISVSCDKSVFKSRLMDIQYVDWTHVVPKHESHVAINRLELLSAINRLLLIANKYTNQLIIKIDKEITLYAEDIDFGQHATENIKCNAPVPSKIGINGKYLLEAISHFSGTELLVYYGEKNESILIKESVDDEDMAVIFPLNLEGYAD